MPKIPEKDKSSVFQIRLQNELLKRVRLMAKEIGAQQSQIIRVALAIGLDAINQARKVANVEFYDGVPSDVKDGPGVGVLEGYEHAR